MLYNEYMTMSDPLKEYIATGKGLCDQSPTGAHHWIIECLDMTTMPRPLMGVCKWCKQKREHIHDSVKIRGI